MANKIFLLPDLGEGLTEAVIVRWLVEVGDTVATDQAVAEVETAKSVVELPTPYAGTITALHGAEGESVDTGAPIIEVEDGSAGDAAPAAAPAASSESAKSDPGPEGEAYRNEERAGTGSGSGNVLIGYGTSEESTRGRRRRRGGKPAVAAPAAEAAPAPAPEPEPADPAAEETPRSGPVAVRSPIVRRLARELGVDVRAIAATGSDGAVTRSDVLAAAEGGASTAATAQTPAVAADGMHGLSIIEQERLSPLRKMVGAKLSTSRREIPEATVWVDVDFTKLWEVRPAMVAAGERAPSVTAIVARFVMKALEQYPLMASQLSADGSEIIRYDGVNLGLAVDSERGLTVPVLPQADSLSIAELDAALRDLSAEARTGRITPQRLTGSTFTLNNYGGLGTDGSTPIINHPEVAMLGMGRIIQRPWVVDGEIVPRHIGTITLVFDHRICDGGYASGFLNQIVSHIENPLLAYPSL